MKKIIIKSKKFFKRLKAENFSEHAAECAYFTILSLVPFIIFFIALIQFTSIDKQIVVNIIKEIVPTSIYAFFLELIDEVYSKSFNTISISLLVALWSASKGFYALCKGLKDIYKLSENKSNIIIRLEGLLYTLLFLICLVVVMILIIFGNRIYEFVLRRFFSFGMIMTLFFKIRTISTVLMLFSAFLILYRFVPKHQMSLKTQIPGALFSSISWVITSYVFSIYIDIFKGFSNTYGSLSSIVLIMMWIYVCMYIILLGAEVNKIIQEYKISKL